MKSKSILLIVLIFVSLGLVTVILLFGLKSPDIKSFTDCKKAGYPIQESYPEVCVGPDGKRFINSSQSVSKKQVCPDEWYDNRMPGPDNKSGDQYFIINHQRTEVDDYDLSWIRQNCTVNKPQVVY